MIIYHITLSGQIQDGSKPVAIVERRKKTCIQYIRYKIREEWIECEEFIECVYAYSLDWKKSPEKMLVSLVS